MFFLIILVLGILFINHCYYLYCIRHHNYHIMFTASVNHQYYHPNFTTNPHYPTSTLYTTSKRYHPQFTPKPPTPTVYPNLYKLHTNPLRDEYLVTTHNISNYHELDIMAQQFLINNFNLYDQPITTINHPRSPMNIVYDLTKPLSFYQTNNDILRFHNYLHLNKYVC